jgi:peptidoglycan hydrolase-like protein with peptidoglycan-binding domain
MYNVYLGLVEAQELIYREGVVIPFPGTILREGSEGEDVTVLQNYLNYISRSYPNIPTLPVTGYYGPQTAAAVSAFLREFGLADNDSVNASAWYAITNVYEDLYLGNTASAGQFPGYDTGGAA